MGILKRLRAVSPDSAACAGALEMSTFYRIDETSPVKVSLH
jgi:hypothetical protein